MRRKGYRRLIGLSFVVVLTLSSLLIVSPMISTVSAQGGCLSTHVVAPGENLFRIGLAYGTTWPVLQQINGIADPNQIYAGQVLCLSASNVGSPLPQPTPNDGTSYPVGLPTNGIFPTIDFNTRSASPGDAIVITGVNFPANETVDIFIAPMGAPYSTTSSGSAVTGSDGTLNTSFTVPSDVGGVALRGPLLSVLVRGRYSGYYGYNFFFNPRP